MEGSGRRAAVLGAYLALAGWSIARAAPPSSTQGPEIRIHRAAGAITVDADLSDPGWQGAEKIETWYETNPGDNVVPRVKTIGYLTYDDKALYAAFQFFDPEPSRIRAPYGDRDAVPSYTD
jgi:hypothetical protein